MLQVHKQPLTAEEVDLFERWNEMVRSGNAGAVGYIRASGESGDLPFAFPTVREADLTTDAAPELRFAASLAQRLFDAWLSDSSRAVFVSPIQRTGENMDGYEQVFASSDINPAHHGSVLLLTAMAGG